MNYKYTLDKSSKKYTCPRCHKKTFVRYVDVESNNYLESSIGRCDRESKCSYHHTPKGNTTLANANQMVTLSPPPSCHPHDVLLCYGNNHIQNHFVSYLLKYFAPIDVKNTIKMYFLGTSNYWHGATIFWQVDAQTNVCAGKVMLYDKNTGNRVKKPYPHINWMHKVLQLEQFVLQQCLFGLHNLCDHEKGSTVCIVESEKTAIIMSILFPGRLWLATGSKSNFKEQLLQPIKTYKIMAFPDKTEYQNWNHKASELRKSGFNIVCSELLEHKNLEEGADLVDFLTQNKKTA